MPNQTQRQNDISWRVVACAACAILWAITFWLLTTLISGQAELMKQVAVINHVLHIDGSRESRDSNRDDTKIYEEHF